MKKELEEYKIEVKKVYEKSQEAFEKQLSFLSAGTLGFSMLFVEKVVDDFNSSNCKLLIICSWLTLGLTLVINLISHHLSAQNNYKTLSEIDNEKYDPDIIHNRIKWINRINWTTILSLLLGVLLFIIYILLNI